MNVSELFDLTQWITNEIDDTEIPAKYQALQQILHRHSQPNQQRQSFEAEKNDLIETLRNVPLSSLTKDQLNFLGELGIHQAVGIEGADVIEDILYKNVIDTATSAQKLQDILHTINEGINKSDQILAGLNGCVYQEEYELDNEILMRVSFTGNAEMSNISDFKNWGNIWYDIGRGIAMVNNSSPEEVKIIGATTGSIVIELAVLAGVATTASTIILSALKVAEKVIDIKMKLEGLRGLEFHNQKIYTELEKEAEDQKKSGIEEISSHIIKQLKIDRKSDGDKVNALEKSIKNLVNFVERGGEVDFVIPEDEEDDDGNTDNNNEELRVAFQEIRQLEKKLALLEHKPQ